LARAAEKNSATAPNTANDVPLNQWLECLEALTLPDYAKCSRLLAGRFRGEVNVSKTVYARWAALAAVSRSVQE
jgi:hypothetical protein